MEETIEKNKSPYDKEKPSSPVREEINLNLIKAKSIKESSPISEEPVKTLDSLFRKTSTKPHIYYLPLTEQEVAEKKKRNIKK